MPKVAPYRGPQQSATSSPNALLEAAIMYARRGYRLVPLHYPTPDGRCSCQHWRDSGARGPCKNPGKHPRFKDFAKLASTDEGQIRQWSRKFPCANKGRIGGKAANLWVLDTDPRNRGDDSRRLLIYTNQQIPYTLTSRTGGGGTHEYFRWPEDLDLPYYTILDDGLEVI